MKPRRVVVSIETTTDASFLDLRRARGGWLTLRDKMGTLLCELAIEQIQANVIRQSKQPKVITRR